MSKTAFRIYLVIVGPLVVAYAYTARLFREFGRAFWWAQNAAAQEIEMLREYWRNGSPR